MRLTFRQGISRYQTDVYATASFLQKNGEFVDLIVSPDPTIIIFAHKAATYIIEESKTVLTAWGPFTGSATRYLYWDINLLDGSLTRGYTAFAPIYSTVEPTNPSADQHWFDKTNHQMKVWTSGRWIDKLRVFAAIYSSQAVIQAYPLGSQAGENGTFEGGNLVRDAYNKPLRQSDGTFVTTATNLSVVNSAANTVSLEAEVITAMALENIPKFSFVKVDPNQRVSLARSDDWRTRIVGMVSEDLYISEVGNIVSTGLIQNEQWNWPLNVAGRPVFCGPTGEITLVPPSHGVLQVVGYVFNPTSIYLNIQNPLILDDIRSNVIGLPTGPIGIAPAANFTVSQTAGVAPLAVDFKNTSLHAPTVFAWDFNGDGQTDSTQSDATWTFTTPGNYTAKLTVSNEFGKDVKTQTITVSAPVATGTKTNIGIQLSGALQVSVQDVFPVQVIISNASVLAATNVKRIITIDDADNAHIELSAVPTGTIVTHIGNTTVLTMPTISSLASRQTNTAAFSIKAPKKASVINIRAAVISQEADSSLSDNATALSIRVK